MKKRVLTGIQPSGRLHIGNYFGTIKRMVNYQATSDLFLMIVNLHSLTSVSDGKLLKKMTLDAAADMLALGIDPTSSTFWVQSNVPEHAELAWILSCLTPVGLLERATSFKDKIAKGILPNAGLFNYPVLQTADIVLYQADLVPVGKDQKQHLEMSRDITLKFNSTFGETFTLPEPEISEDVAVIPGTDGQKMSKSYNNTIPIFAEEAEWKKAVMSIITDSKGVEEAKDPKTCNVFQLYKLFADAEEQKALTERYQKGGLGYGDVKKMLLQKLIAYFGPMSQKRKHYADHPDEVREILKKGAAKAKKIAVETMAKVREATGLNY